MDAKLVRAAGAWAQLQPGAAVAGAENPIIGNRALSGRIDDHAPSSRACQFLEAGLEPTLGVGRLAFHDSPIDSFHLPARKQGAQPAQRLRMPAKQETAAGVAVEPMSKRGRVGQTEAQLIKVAFEVRAAAGPAMHGNPSRLVDDQYQAVAIEDSLGESRQGGFSSLSIE